VEEPRQRRRHPRHPALLCGRCRGGDRGAEPLRGAPARRRDRDGRRGQRRRAGDRRGAGARGAALMSLSLVKELREKTGAGLLDCQKALGEAEGDLDKALRLLREKGLAKAAKRASRIPAYAHPGGKIGVLVEVNCETDFVAKTDEFQQLVRDLAMQVAASSPRYVRREEVPEAEQESERAIYRVQAEQSGKPPQVIERIIAGQLERYLKDVCLL